MATRQGYEDKLKDLRIEVMRMGGLVEEAVSKAAFSMLKQDPALTDQVRRGEVAINHQELVIEDKCVIIIATEQPVAHDLRQIISTLKSTRELERIGDYAAHLASASSRLFGGKTIDQFPQQVPQRIRQMLEISIRMIKDTIAAFGAEDTALCREIMDRDDQIDSLYLEVFKEFLTEIQNSPENAAQLNTLIFISKYIERLADHIINICEEVIYMHTGERIEKPT
ncbi:MAG TPA: phosphate signaling complex protein PhoU [Spirochaetia bacterium]|nr:phosphate signaling complex protein PhoU [Spirochaetia bacterium]